MTEAMELVSRHQGRASESEGPPSGESGEHDVGVGRREHTQFLMGQASQAGPLCTEEAHVERSQGPCTCHMQKGTVMGTGMAGFWGTQCFHSVLRTQASRVETADQVTRSKYRSVLSEVFNKHFCQPEE